MNIEDYADALNLELVIRRYPNQSNRYTAHPCAAVADYVDQIRGKVLVVSSSFPPTNRRVYVVPKALTA